MPDRLLKKLITYNKRLKVVEIIAPPTSTAEIIQKLKYVHSLQSVLVEGQPTFSHKNYIDVLRSNKYHLEKVAITGQLPAVYNFEKERINELFDAIVSLPKLKTFKFDAALPLQSNIDNILFTKLAERNVKYDLRIFHSKNKLAFENNASCFEKVTLLAINTKERWPHQILYFDRTQEEFLASQENANHSLFLNLFAMPLVDISNLFQTCRNISVLDLFCLQEKPFNYDAFIHLQNLPNLKEIYVNMQGYSIGVPPKLFENLAICVKKYQTLNLVALRFFEGELPQCNTMLPFWEECSKSVTKVILQFNQVKETPLVINMFYQGIKKLKDLRSLTVLINRVAEWSEALDMFHNHARNLSQIIETQESLEEFSFFAPYIGIERTGIEFDKAKNLKKFATDCWRHGFALEDLENVLKLRSLTYLEIDLPINSEDRWRDFVKKFESLDKLEIALFRSSVNYWNEHLKNQMLQNLKTLISRHKSLKLVILVEEATSILNIVKNDSSQADFDELHQKLFPSHYFIKSDKIFFR